MLLASGLDAIPAGLWSVATAFVAGLFASIGYGFRFLSESRRNEKELVDRVINDVVPALAESTEASKASTAVVREITVMLAIQQARKDDEGRRPTPRRQ